MMLASYVWAAPEWGLPAIGLVAAALIAVVWSYWRCATDSWVRLVAGLLKMLAVVLLALCLIEPLFSGIRPRPGANRFVILADEAQDGPSSDEIGFASDDIPVPGSGQWATLDLTTTSFATSLNSGDWIIGIQHGGMTDWYIGIDTSVENPTCYRDAGTWMEGTMFGGIYMIRGKGTYSN